MTAAVWVTAATAHAAPFPDGGERPPEALSLVRPGNPVDGERRVGRTPKSLTPNTGMLLVRSGATQEEIAAPNATPAARSSKTSKAKHAKSKNMSGTKSTARSVKPGKAAKPARAAKAARVARPVAGIKAPSVGPVSAAGLVSRGSSGRGPLKALGVSIPGVSKSNKGRGKRGGDDD